MESGDHQQVVVESANNLPESDGDKVQKLLERIASLEEENRRLEKLVVTDALTELKNRRGWDESREILVETLQRHGEEGVVICLVIDVDNFKLINDGYGHGKGDEALRRIAGVIKGVFSRGDDIVARSGGDEFGVMAVVDNFEIGERMAEDVRAGVEDIKIEGVQHRLGVSVGVAGMEIKALRDMAEIDSTKDDVRLVAGKMLEKADGMAYRTKEQGRNRVVSR